MFKVAVCKYKNKISISKINSVYIGLQFLQFLFDSPNNIPFGVFCHACTIFQLCQKSYEIRNPVLSLDECFFVPVDFWRVEIIGVSEVIIDVIVYLKPSSYLGHACLFLQCRVFPVFVEHRE